MLFNEPKLLKCIRCAAHALNRTRFSALQRAEIAEIRIDRPEREIVHQVSVLFNEPKLLKLTDKSIVIAAKTGFSALQRAEIAEIVVVTHHKHPALTVSVLFNEPKLLKSVTGGITTNDWNAFQCSSTSRNC